MTQNFGSHFTCAALMAALSVSPVLEQLQRPHEASLHRCPAVTLHAWALSTWVPLSKASPKRAPPSTVPWLRGPAYPQRQFLAPTVILTTTFLFIEAMLPLIWRETFIPAHNHFFLLSFSYEAPSAFQLVIALVRWNGLAGEITSLYFPVLVLPKLTQKYVSQGLRLIPKFITVLCYRSGRNIFLEISGVSSMTTCLPEDSLQNPVEIHVLYYV